MKSKTSLFNKSLMKSDLKRFWWISSLYMLVLFFILPFNHLVAGPPGADKYRQEMFRRSLDLSSGQNELQILLIIVVPVLMAALLFKYLHTARSAAMMHGLPYARKTLYFNHGLSGLLLLVAPVLCNALVLMVLQSATFLKEYYSLGDIWTWAGYTLLFNTLFYGMGIFMGMFTGNAIAQIVFTYILQILPEGFHMLLSYNLRQLLFGYADTSFQGSFFNSLPLLVLLNGRLTPEYFGPGQIAGYLILAGLFFLCAYYVYKIRKLESSGDIVAFPFFRPVFKYGVTLCSMLLGGAYFAGISNGSFAVTVFGYLFCSFLGYCIAEILLQKSFRVWPAYKGYLAYTVLLVVLLVGIKTDFIGYQTRVPDLDQVEKVYLGNYFGNWTQVELEKGKEKAWESDQKEREYSTAYDRGAFFHGKENIENVIKLHRHFVEQRPDKKEGPYRYIIYTMKDGTHLIREYPMENNAKNAPFLQPIYESMEYKEARFPVLTQDLSQIKLVEIKDDRTPKRPLILTESGEIKEFTDLFRQEIRSASLPVLLSEKNIYTNIRITDQKGNIQYYQMPKEYRTLFQWLQTKGYYDQVMLLLNEVGYAELEKQNRGYEERAADGQALPKRVKIEDPKVIQELLELCENYRYDQEKEQIDVMFSIRGGTLSQFHGTINEGTPVSESLSAYLKRL
ncbi:DUF6449 domain-containing protein [Candidatus Formimonas warabiya]|uniref:DUF6449 domain-containing protein n=1 Tax=Formimonas warabiya TaxID=1761012 RepID=A0A3G1KXZ1_FORW1|nr:DUF6449 domain-containing protein [Candidatus Formimonas warabiya]ATW27312.1 hypothetical protein DCMF_23450 [Candidatus Formimonas warabiya]